MKMSESERGRKAGLVSGIARKIKARIHRKVRMNTAGYPCLSRVVLTDKELSLLPGCGHLVLIHRLVAAKKYNRPILRGEIVRHIDGDKTNYRPYNLVIGSQSDNAGDHVSLIKSASRRRQVMIDILGILHG